MNRVAVLNVVGLTRGLIGEHMPRIAAFAETAGVQSFPAAFPAVTCTAQSAYLTGQKADTHGIVGNGWYDRDECEVKFWKQSNKLVQAPKIWERLKADDGDFTCANLFWWYAMYSSVDTMVTPRPLYLPDGKKVFDVHSNPMQLREEIKGELGDFPFPAFWGPRAGIASSRWIADAAKYVELQDSPGLSLVYLPHLDYSLQKVGPEHESIPGELAAIDEVVGDLLDLYEERGVEVMIVSEYGIRSVSKPVHLNRLFRERGWIQVKDELGKETLDAGTSRAFAVADHQVAHVYLLNPADLEMVQRFLESVDGVESVQRGRHVREGDLVVTANGDAWFTYYFWLDDAKAPPYARLIDIHRKPGYDPCELFIDPAIKRPKLKLATFLLKKALGFRTMLDVIPLDAQLVKGSHGRVEADAKEQPLVIGSPVDVVKATDVYEAIYQKVKR